MKLTMVGHSTVLVESGATRVVMDPFFGSGNVAYGRVAPPQPGRDGIGPVDGVLISHTHFDHFDGRYLRSLSREVPVHVAAAGAIWGGIKARRWLRPLRSWDVVRIGEIEVTAVPARHIAPTVGFVLRDGVHSVYFAGDTYFGSFMREIARRLEPRVCLLPVATFRLPMTMGNASALEATRVLRPEVVIPIHQGIRPRSPLLRRRESAETFRTLVERAGLPIEVCILAPGETFECPVRGEVAAGAAEIRERPHLPAPAGVLMS